MVVAVMVMVVAVVVMVAAVMVVQVSSVQNGIDALGRKPILCTSPPCLSRVFVFSIAVALESVNIGLIDNGPVSSFQGRSPTAACLCLSVSPSNTSSALCPRVVIMMF